jgi:hypothetical protein
MKEGRERERERERTKGDRGEMLVFLIFLREMNCVLSSLLIEERNIERLKKKLICFFFLFWVN